MIKTLFIFNLYNIINLVLLIIITHKTKEEYSQIMSFESEYPTSFNLNNGNILIIAQYGIYLFQQSQGSLKTILNFTSEEMISTEDECSKTTFVQLPDQDGGNVLCLIKDKLYLFSPNIDLINKFDLSNEINGKSYSLVHYKNENNYIYYVIAFIQEETFKIFYYRMKTDLNLENSTNEIISDLIFETKASNGKEVKNFNKAFSCEKMKNSTLGIVLVCFYECRNNYEIGVSLFNPDNNITQISSLSPALIQVTQLIEFIKTAVLEDKSTALICYDYNGGTDTYCSFYNINYNKFTEPVQYSDACKPNANSIRVNYFSQTKQFLFTCGDASSSFKFTLFDKDNNVIIDAKKENIISCYSFQSLSITYISSNLTYSIILDGNCEPNGILTRLFSIDHIYKNITHNISIFNTSNSLISSSYLLSSIIPPSSFLSHFYSSQPYSLISTSLLSSSSSLYNKNISFSSDLSNYTLLSNLNNFISSIISSSEKLLFSSIFKSFLSSIISSNPLLSTISKSTYLLKSSLPNILCEKYFYYDNNECLNYIPEGFYLFDENKNIIKKCHDSCKLCVKGSNQISNNCQKCKNDNHFLEEGNCVDKCSYNYISNNNNMICEPRLEDEYLCPENKPYKYKDNRTCVKSCDINELLEKKCEINRVTDETLKEFNDQIDGIILNYSIGNETNIFIQGNDIIFHITTTDNIKNNEYNNISTINFGECEKTIKEEYQIDYIIIKKIDIKATETIIVLYELYNPVTKHKINLFICENKKIEISTPINIEEKFITNYKELLKEGYNILDPNDPFYNDICSPYTSANNTDIILLDRKYNYFNDNLTYCQTDCSFKGIDIETEKVICECQANENKNNEISNIKFSKLELTNSFYKISKYSNFIVIICYKLVFSQKGQIYNIGSYLLILFIIIFLIIQIKFILNQKLLVANLIKTLLKSLKIDISFNNGMISEIKSFPPKKKKIKKKKIKKNNNNVFLFLNKKQINNQSSSRIQLDNLNVNFTGTINNLAIFKKKIIQLRFLEKERKIKK